MAKGSHTTRGDYPTHCHICGKVVRVSKDNCWYMFDHIAKPPQMYSFHVQCRTGPGITEAQLWGTNT